ncbi:MAG: hypothetical protein ACOYXY_15680 [Thermodesulfobacteriota bacterium]
MQAFFPDPLKRQFLLHRHRTMIRILALLVALLLAAPTVAVSLPWTSEKDRIEKRLNEIWQALLKNDQYRLRAYVLGPGEDAFINQELDVIKRFGITDYECKALNVSLDPVYGQMAWVEVELIATLDDGESTSRRGLRVLKKIGGEWKLIAQVGKKRSKTRPKAGQEIAPQPPPAPTSERPRPGVE